MAHRKTHDEVAIEIDARPDRVYELVADITRMGEWSSECRSCRWARGATGPAVGARFKARNKGRRGPAWFNTPTVTVANPAREFGFNRSGPGMGSYTWRYVLEPTAAGTRLTESYDVERPLPRPMNWLTTKWVGTTDRDDDLHAGMETTLARIKAAAEAPSTIASVRALGPRGGCRGLPPRCQLGPRPAGDPFIRSPRMRTERRLGVRVARRPIAQNARRARSVDFITPGATLTRRYLCEAGCQGPPCGRLRTGGGGQGGAPAAKRGRTTLTSPRTGADSIWAG